MVGVRGNASRGIYGGFIVSEEQAFLNAINVNLRDTLPMLVFADWLEERGRDEQAEYWRLAAELTLRECPNKFMRCDQFGMIRCTCLPDGVGTEWETKVRRYRLLEWKMMNGKLFEEIAVHIMTASLYRG